MFKNYLRIIIRNIIRNRLSAFINVVGLSVGLASAILIFLYVQYELGFDKYHKQYKNIYRINSVTEHSTGVDYKGCTTAPLAEALRLDYPDFNITLMRNEDSQHVKVNDDVYFEKNIRFIDSVFFEIFDIEMISGNYRDIIENKNSVLLTRELAEKYFGKKNPLGKIIKLEGKYPLKVAGIVESPPKQSSHPFSMIISYDFLSQEYICLLNYDNWGATMSGFGTYVVLPDGYSTDDFQDKVNQTFKKHNPDKTPWEKRYILQSLIDIHFDERFQNVSNTYTINRSNILIYSLIGILIMIIASINFINLATAQAIKRSKEVGVRKVLGAVRNRIFSQFIFETVFLTFSAVIMALILVEIFIPYLNNFLGNNIQLSIYNSKYFFVFLFIIFLIVSFCTGFYPGLVLSRFNPAMALKNTANAPRIQKLSFRSVLVILQFVISIGLIVCTIFIYRQVNYLKNKELGFTKENIAVFSHPGSDIENQKRIGNYLLSSPGVLDYTFGIGSPTSYSNIGMSFSTPDLDNEHDFYLNVKPVDTNYLKTFGLELVAGKWFESMHPEDTNYKFVINEKFVQLLGFNNSDDALRMRLWISNLNGKVTGVIKDFHIQSLHNEIEPLVFMYLPQLNNKLLVKIHPDRTQESIQAIEKFMKEIFPDYVVQYHFLEDQINELYESENRIFHIISVFSIIAIVIACLGLFGMVSYIVVQRTKEIGIRKVLGASVNGLIAQLSKEYLLLVIIANIIALPISYYFIVRWLNNFVYRIKIEWWVFLLAALITLFIAFLTMAYNAFKTANSNPVDALKYE